MWSSRSAAPLVIPGIIAGIALAARLYGLGDKPFWYDEILTLLRASLPFADLAADAIHNKHLPTYFLLVAPFAAPDWSEWWLRLPSAVFGAGCAFLVARIAFDCAGVTAALVAGLLMALSPLEVQYGQEARSYTLASSAILLSLWGAIGLFSSQDKPHRRAHWLAYAGGMTLALYTLSVAIPWLIAANLTAAALLYSARRARAGIIRNWFAANGFVAVLWLPAIAWLLIANQGAAQRGMNWIPEATWDSAVRLIQALYMFRVPNFLTFQLEPAPVPGFGLAILLLAALGAWSMRTRPRAHTFILVAALTMPLALAVVSLIQPLVLSRYLLWSTGPVFVLAGLGAAALPQLAGRLAVALIATAGTLSLWPYYTAETKPRWDLAAAHLATRITPDHSVITSTGLARLVLRTYAAREVPASDAAFEEHTMDEIGERFASGKTVWVVHGPAGQDAIEPADAFARNLRALGQPVATEKFGSQITLWRFEKP